jgi:hypothetical protein
MKMGAHKGILSLAQHEAWEKIGLKKKKYLK